MINYETQGISGEVIDTMMFGSLGIDARARRSYGYGDSRGGSGD